MPLRFRNIDATPDDPVASWGFEGMLAAIDRGYPKDWKKLAGAVARDDDLRTSFDAAAVAAESRSTVLLLELMISERRQTARERALERLQDAYRVTGMTQGDLAAAIGTSRTRLNSYLNGHVIPPMDVLVEVERIANRRVAPLLAPQLIMA